MSTTARVFSRWREAIDAGVLRAPFHVTHVDAHVDLGLGDAGYMHLMTDLLFRAPEERRDPGEHLEDGNYLIFAAGCRWLSGLDYVYNSDDPDGHGPGDILRFVMEDFRADAAYIHLAAMTREEFDALLWMRDKPQPLRREPRIPFRAVSWRQFTAPEPFDAICLARSPSTRPHQRRAL